ncbi:hypothetical protein PHPALM_17859 [Phytophthora palmivora]|uniref:MIF4G domain-containing protein n=1 Tax=Phytophthora palmivora TaxID=4796 RepID=A0A2P4XL61_9STRA|nr:hypothetical protein PHPALM_17859 [Phytophthora palmivora]
MSKLNPNAGEWVPTYVSSPAKSMSPVKEKPQTPVKKEPETPSPASANNKTALERAAEFGHDVALDENGEAISYEGYSPLHDRFIYSKEYLLSFKPLGDRVIKSIPDVVRNPTKPKFQPLYEMMPEDFTWADTIGADAVMGENKGKKGKKDKNRQQRGNVMPYDASLVCYFNPTEYAAAMNMGLYTGPPTDETGNSSDGKTKAPVAEPVNPVEEAIIAKRRIATLLDGVKPDAVSSILESFMTITISCTHTLQEIIGLLFDHAIATPDLSESYAKLCTGMSERTPEFKDGAKTINFRRILLTKCYESLIEEPDVGDLLDGSSPASRRTMDEYFAVLVRIQENCELPDRVKKQIKQLKSVRAGGWIKNRQDNQSASSTPVASPAKLSDSGENNGTPGSPVKTISTAPVTGDASPAESRTDDP